MAGLLDSLFQPGSGGLLDFLRNNAMSQNYPSGLPSDQAQYGAPQSPLNAYAAMRRPAPQAVPAPQAPAPQAPQAAPQAPMTVPGLSSYSNNPLSGLAKIISNIPRAGMDDPNLIAQRNLQTQFEATRQALISNGYDPQRAASTAMLATLNPEAAKTVLPEMLTNKEKYQVISEDPLAGKQYGFVNERDQTINGKPLGAAGAQGNIVGGPQGYQGLQQLTQDLDAMRSQGATQEQMLAQVPTMYRGYVAGVLSGKALPTNMGRAAIRGPIMALAHAVDNNFDETQIPVRMQVQKDFSGEGKNGQAIGSFNTVQNHIDELSDAVENLSKYSGDYPTLNAARAYLANKANTNPALRDAVQQVNDKMNAVSHEMANAYNAGHLSDHDMASWNALTNSNLPPDQLRRGIADFVTLLNGKRDSLNNIYQTTFGRDAPTINKAANAATTAKAMSRVPSFDANGNRIAPQASAPAPAPSLKVGESATVGGVTIKKVKD